MKTFNTPAVEVKKFDLEDVLTASLETTEEEEETLPVMWGNCL